MQHATETIIDFLGLQPAFSNIQLVKPSVIRGRNFRFNLRGIYSGWGNSISAQVLPDESFFPATFRQDDRVVLVTQHGLYSSASKCAPWQPCLSYPKIQRVDPRDEDYPISQAYAGNVYYYAHPQIGIVAYDTIHKSCHMVDLTCFSGPIYGITQALNRLIVLAKDTVSWSRPDNGDKLDCSLHKGAGFQSLSIAKYGRPLAVKPTRNGFAVYTTNALLQFSETAPLAGFRVDVISEELVPINPWAVVARDNLTHIFLAKSGLYAYNGQSYPEEIQHVVGRYLVEIELPRLQHLLDTHAIALFDSPSTQETFISILGYDGSADHWQRSLVYHWGLDKWSSFDQPHLWIGPSVFDEERIHTIDLGFIHYDRYPRHFDSTRGIVEPTGIGCESDLKPIDSWVELGLFHIPVQDSQTRDSVLNNVIVHSGPMISTAAWRHSQALLEKVDQWKENAEIYNEFALFAMSTNDGYATASFNWMAGHIVESTVYMRNYALDNIGRYHTIRIVAENPGEYYEINAISLDYGATIKL